MGSGLYSAMTDYPLPFGAGCYDRQHEKYVQRSPLFLNRAIL
jgi:hypothetical protein